jgi:hypothetical protein
MWWVLVLIAAIGHADTADEVAADLRNWKSHRPPGTAPDIPASVYRQAINGKVATGIEVVEDIKAAKGYGVAVFDVPIEVFWRAVTDEDHHANKLPVTHSRTIEGTPRAHDHTLFQYMDIPLFTDRWWLVRIRYNSSLYTASNGRAWELTWVDRLKETHLRKKLDPALLADSMPIAWSKGAWLLVDLGGGRTLVEYHTWSDPGGYVPVGPATRFAAGEVETTLVNMSNFAKKHTPTCSGTFMRPDGSRF